jgi:ATPase subunit of ABC transporter with duplicated ATPase domains
MLIAKNLSYNHDGEDLFDNVDISLDSKAQKRIAVVGKNGCGKSTLLKLLAGMLEPVKGNISMSGEVVKYLKQDINFTEADGTVEAYLTTKLEEEWMSYMIDMAFEEVGLSEEAKGLKLVELSGGQKVRVGLVELLLKQPTILLLDEPTNHLDQESIEWLKGFVNNFNGSIAYVSHDRNFINETANQIWEITPSKEIQIYSCNYDQFLVERYDRYQKALQEYNFSQRERIELEEWLRENANHTKYKFTATVAQKKKALERMEKGAPPEPVMDPRIKMHDLEYSEKGTVLTAKVAGKSFDGRRILENLEFKILHGEKVWIKGLNGSGKTTLLNILAGEDKEFEGSITRRDGIKIGYLKQFSELNEESAILDEFDTRTEIDYTLVRSILSNYLFPADILENKIKYLSYGQKRRLELAIMLTNKPDLLILDEPTNHLDIFVREELEKFLLEQEIAMAIVSHDRYFIDKIGITKTIELSA